MHNIIERPSIYLNSFTGNPGLSYSKRKYLDEAQYEYYGDSYLAFQINKQQNGMIAYFVYFNTVSNLEYLV